MDHLHEAQQSIVAAEREVLIGDDIEDDAEIDNPAAVAAALIGIGHALIAIAEKLP